MALPEQVVRYIDLVPVRERLTTLVAKLKESTAEDKEALAKILTAKEEHLLSVEKEMKDLEYYFSKMQINIEDYK